jgi:hypothetical protein
MTQTLYAHMNKKLIIIIKEQTGSLLHQALCKRLSENLTIFPKNKYSVCLSKRVKVKKEKNK